MKSLYLILLLSAFVFIAPCYSQDDKIGYVLEVRGDKVYLDLKEGDIANGNKVKVVKEGGFFTHPVTGEKIKEDDETIAILEIVDVRSSYSISTAFPKEAISSIQQGQKVSKVDGDDLAVQNQSGIFKKSIAVQPLTVSNIQGYLGIYIGDVLTEQFLKTDIFKVLDRQTLGLQADQIVLSSGGVLTDAELLRYSSNKGADYYISGTMYEPDVVELSSGIPLKNIVSVVGGAAEAITGKNLGVSTIAEFVPERTEIKKLKAVVRITLKVIDVSTGEIKFMCTEMQEAIGESEINMEGGLLGGLKVRGGASSFLNTITGKATQVALTNLTNYILGYFNGKITEKTFTGNIVDIKALTSTNYTGINSGLKITQLMKKPKPYIPGYDKPDTTLVATLNHGHDKKIKPKSTINVYYPKYDVSASDGRELSSGLTKIGRIYILKSFDDSSEGRFYLRRNSMQYEDIDLNATSLGTKNTWLTFYSKVNINTFTAPGIKGGFMIYNKWIGCYLESGVLGLHRSYNEAMGSAGLVKTISSNSALTAGFGLAYGPPSSVSRFLKIIELGGVTRFNRISLIYGLYGSFDKGIYEYEDREDVIIGFNFGIGLNL